VSWYELVYGRTPHYDRWWRTRPSCVADRDEWLDAVVHAVLANGSDLEQPRLLLAQDDRYRVVGVACEADRLSETMNTDSGVPGKGRLLYGFVGWLAEATDDGWPPVPGRAALAEQAERWAKPVYERWMGRVWQGPPPKAREHEVSSAAAAPWTVGDATSERRGGYPPIGRDLVLLPAADADLVWAEALNGTQATVVTCGWGRVHAVPRQQAMYACVDELTQRRTIVLEQIQDADTLEPRTAESPLPAGIQPESWPGPRSKSEPEPESWPGRRPEPKRREGGLLGRLKVALDQVRSEQAEWSERRDRPEQPVRPEQLVRPERRDPTEPPEPPSPRRRPSSEGPLTRQRRLAAPDQREQPPPQEPQ